MSADDPLVREALRLRDDAEIHSILEELCALTGMGFAAVARVTEDRRDEFLKTIETVLAKVQWSK